MIVTAMHDKIAISARSHRILGTVLGENPELARILHESESEDEAVDRVRRWVLAGLVSRPRALAYYRGEATQREDFEALDWGDFAALRLLDYCDSAGEHFHDLNLHGDYAYSHPIRLLWLAARFQSGGGKPDFFQDWLHLMRQYTGRDRRGVPSRSRVEAWMARHPSGIEPEVAALRAGNRDRILRVLIEKIDQELVRSGRYAYPVDYPISAAVTACRARTSAGGWRLRWRAPSADGGQREVTVCGLACWRKSSRPASWLRWCAP
ncbi:MAG: hypothetical protein KKI08_11855 [Armatimonadetes bacterium]|nr:hypothetical protein [Armatimonadota bacterium]